jgi:ubiquinone/menaquinone biosynthesis C-methylase UbiE
MDPLPDKLKILMGGRILDVATGFGDFLKLLTDSFETFGDAIGIDSSENIIEAARRRQDKKLVFEVMDAGEMKFGSDFFDTVAIRHSLHHLEQVDRVLDEMSRVLKPGGLFIVCEVFQRPGTNFDNAQRHLHHWWAAVDRELGETHYDTMTDKEILEKVERLCLADSELIIYTPQLDENKHREALESMLQKCGIYLEKLRDMSGHEDLITRGEELMERFNRKGFVTESALYILGRK